jgi:hypothetical protein
LTNGSTNYSFNGINGTPIFADTGSYDLAITGYLYGQAIILNSNAIFYINSLDSTIITSSICTGETYILGSQTLSTPGTYVETFNTPTCDSVVTFTLSIYSVDTDVDQQDNVLTANLSTGTSYQWLDCDDNWTVIPNETNQTFIANENGNYAVVILDQNCSDTSDCLVIAGLSHLGIDEVNVSIFPNPAKEKITIQLNQNYSKVDIDIFNDLGQLVKQIDQVNLNTIILDLKSFSKGIYHIRIKADDNTKNVEIIKI